MKESINYEEFSHLRYLKEQRDWLKQEKLDVERLTVQSGSQDPVLAEKAKDILMRQWDLDPEKDAERAPTIDLMKQLGNYSEEERKLIFGQLASIQLTEGCNGNCPFCLFGKKKGVESKYSFKSLDSFFHKYGKFLRKGAYLYWNSDPFDYRDGKHNFLDVYKLWREVKPRESHYVSTAIPRGSEQDFINFMRYIAKKWRHDAFSELLTVRVSLAKHNAQRGEAVFEKLTGALLKDGFSSKEINIFVSKFVQFETRFDALHLGSLIGGHDDVRDIETPACSDGVIMAPKSVRAIMMTAPTIYEPSGEKDIEVVPGFSEKQAPSALHIDDYRGFGIFSRSPADRVHAKKIILPPIKTAEGEMYTLENPVDDVVLRLGREAFSFGSLIGQLEKLPLPGGFSDVSEKGLKFFLRESAADFRKRQENISTLIKRAEALVAGDSLSSYESDKIKFYILLIRTYEAEMDFLAGHIEDNRPLEAVRLIASIFRHVGREQVPQLSQIISDLSQLREKITTSSFRDKEFSQVQNIIMLKLAAYFGFKNTLPPPWLSYAVNSYCDSLKKKG